MSAGELLDRGDAEMIIRGAAYARVHRQKAVIKIKAALAKAENKVFDPVFQTTLIELLDKR
jgi:hypothetical protein